jgi:hypothetical protein
MTYIDIFYQGEGIRGIEHIEADPEHTFGAVKALIVEKHGLANDVLLFLENSEEPLDELLGVTSHAGQTGINAHLHRCHHIEVAVTFVNETVHHRFSPGATIARVKRWAAEDKFRMTEEEAGEHVLQIAGTQDRPAPGTHLGSLAPCPECHIAFDLVPDHRVNGAADAAGEDLT